MEIFISPTIGIVWIVAMFIFIANEKIWGTIISTALAIALFRYATDSFMWMADISILGWVSIISVYLVAGVAWMVFKWDRFSAQFYDIMELKMNNIVNDMQKRIPAELFASAAFDISNERVIEFLEADYESESKLQRFYEAAAKNYKSEEGKNYDARDYQNIEAIAKDIKGREVVENPYGNVANNISRWRREWSEKKMTAADASYGSHVSFPLQSKEFKERIAMWGMWWMFSFVWTVASDFIVNFWKHVVTFLRGFLDKASDRRFKKTFGG